MTPSSELREAAKRVREVAEEATPGPWRDRNPLVAADGTAVARTFWTDAEHIALWDPAVAVLVADILTLAATSAEAMEWQNGREGERTRVLPSELDVVALDLARRINAGGA